MNLDICGIDIVAEDITQPITQKTGAVIEVNAGPGFRMHLSPTQGTPRNVGEAVIKMLYPNGASSRIPIVAVTGTNGKTTTTRIIAHLAKNAAKLLVIQLPMEFISRISKYIPAIAAALQVLKLY